MLPDGLLKRPQDLPKDADNDRLTAQTDQVLKPARICAINALPDKDSDERAPELDHKVNTNHNNKNIHGINADIQLDLQRANA